MTAILKYYDLPTSYTFGHVNVVQSVIYLAQAAGVYLNYNYKWYTNGPFSNDLNKDLAQMPSPLSLGEKTQEVLDKLRPLVDVIKKDLYYGRTAHLHVDVLFALRTKQAKLFDLRALRALLAKAGRIYSLAEIRKATTVFQQLGLVE